MGDTQAVEPPSALCERLERLLPPEALADWWEAFRGRPLTGFRVNLLKAQPAQVLPELEAAAIAVAPLSWYPLGFTVAAADRRRLTETAAVAAGSLYIQNPSSMLPPLLLDPRAGERVLDLAAAPGGKTLQLAAQMRGGGQLAAVESVRGRFFRLRRNLEAGGAAGVQTYLRDGGTVWRDCPERFDRILLDAPCSGDGGLNSHAPDACASWSLARVRQMVPRQRRLLLSAVHSLRPGGVLVYSTCTLAPEENEGVVSWALERFGQELVVEPLDLALPNLLPGVTEWGGRVFARGVAAARRVVPTAAMEGFFLCRIRKVRSTLSDADQPGPAPGGRPGPAGGRARRDGGGRRGGTA